MKCISIQFFVPEGQPIVWRGPLVGGAIQQFLRDVDWGELDYLVIDLPPGTSDAQLTLAQAVPLGGAVLVTTPQEVALADVAKALAMFKRLSVPILGLVENMTAFVCPHCGEATEIFGRGGGERFAASTASTSSAASRSTSRSARAATSASRPSPSASRAGRARALTAIAGAVAARMSVRAAGADQPSRSSRSADQLGIDFPAGERTGGTERRPPGALRDVWRRDSPCRQVLRPVRGAVADAATGHRRAPAATDPERGDRRIVTALFADLVDYVRLVAEHDPEDVRRQVDSALQAMYGRKER